MNGFRLSLSPRSYLQGPTRYDSVGCDEGRFIFPEECEAEGVAIAFEVAIATLSGQVLTFVLYNSSNNFYVFQTS